MPASMPVPTAAIGCALVKISASGPMPTSRYWLHAPCSISTCFSCAASADPGFSLRQVVADQPVHLGADRRGGVQVAARALLDHALDHRDDEGHAGGLDRLQIDRREQPRLAADRACPAACWPARRPALPMRSPRARRADAAAGSRGLAQVAHGRESRRMISTSSPSRTATTDGPADIRPPDAPGQRAPARRRPAAPAATRREIRPSPVLPTPGRHPILWPTMNRGGRPMRLFGVVTRSGHRDVSRHPYRGGVAREAVTRAIPGAAQARHGARRHQSAERGEAARQVRLRRLRPGAVRVGHQVRERHRLAELLGSRWRARSAPPRTAASS